MGQLFDSPDEINLLNCSRTHESWLSSVTRKKPLEGQE